MEPVKIFYCCTNIYEDKILRDKLDIHLMSLKRLKQITLCLTREILAGSDWSRERDERLQMADLILLLISPEFIASDYHYGVEMQLAFTRQQAGNVLVIPIILRPTSLLENHFGKLQILPRNGISIEMHANRDEACVAIVKEVSEMVESHLRRKYPFLSMSDAETLPDGSPIVAPLCVTCGVQNPAGMSICINCRDLLFTDAAIAFSPPSVPTVSSGNALICPKCGYSNRLGAKFCRNDGQPLPPNSNPPQVSLQVGPALQVPLQGGSSPQVGPVSPYPPYMRLQLDSDGPNGDVRRSFVANGTAFAKWPDKGQIPPGKGAFQYIGKTCILKRDSSGMSMMYASTFLNFGQPVALKDFAFRVEMKFIQSPTHVRGGIVFRAINDARGQRCYCFSLCTDNTCSLDFIENNKHINIASGSINVDFNTSIQLGGVIEGDRLDLSINSLLLGSVIDTNCSRGSIGIAVGDLSNDYHSEIYFSRFKVWTR